MQSLGTDQEAVGGPLDDLGNGCGPGFTASGPDGDGETDELLGQGLGIGTRVEASPGAIGEAARPPALEGCRRRRRCAIGAGGGFRREAEEGPVLVSIEERNDRWASGWESMNHELSRVQEELGQLMEELRGVERAIREMAKKVADRARRVFDRRQTGELVRGAFRPSQEPQPERGRAKGELPKKPREPNVCR